MISQNENTVIVSRPKGIYRGFTKSLVVVLIPLMFLHFTLISIADKAPGRELPQPGEKLTYEVRWGIIPAGEVTVEVLPKQTINGIEVYHFVLFAKTSELVDLFYKIRERQDSYVDVGMTHSIFYKKKTESRHPRDESITFDWEKLEATYTNFGATKPPIHIPPGSFDPLGLFYALRFQHPNPKENSEIYTPLTDGNLNIEVKAIFGKRDVIEFEGKTYDTIEITPDMEMVNNLDKQKVVKKSDHPQLKAWVTDDEKKIPIKIRSKVGIISFDADIVSGLY